MKSSMSSPAVNTPEPPVMIMQRMSGLFCAVSIARLISRYMSCVIAFFLLGRRRVITRVPRSSVTMMLPFGMKEPLRSPRHLHWLDSRNVSLHHLGGVPMRWLDLLDTEFA